MSKMGDWVLELELDKIDLTREQFVQKYGTRFAYIWDEHMRLVPASKKEEEKACMC